MAAIGRIQWVDGCKGLTILMVLLGHTIRTDLSLVYIYGFHMPLFFFLSGLVCNEKKYDWCSFLKSRFNSLVLPYIAFYLLTWIYWLFVERSFRPLGMEWWQPLIGLVYGAQWNEYMSVNGILWFLPCLFVTEMLFYAVKNFRSKWIQLAVVVLMTCIGYLFQTNLPWCLNISLVALQFFFVGNIFRETILKPSERSEIHRQNKQNVWMLVLAAILLFLYLMLSTVWKNQVNMATNKYGNLIVFEILSFIGVVGVVIACKHMNFNMIVRVWGGWIGRNTLAIFALHQPILRIVRFIGGKMLHSFPVETNLWYAILADTIVVFCLIPLIWIYNKYGSPLLKKLYIK